MKVITAEQRQEARTKQANVGSEPKSASLAARNAENGSPLFPVSWFMPSTDPKKVTCVLGGGGCHEFPIAVVGLATVLTEVPGQVKVQGREPNSRKIVPDKIEVSSNELSFAQIPRTFMTFFQFEHKLSGITLSVTGAKNRNIDVKLTFLDAGDSREEAEEKLRAALWEPTQFITKDGSRIETIAFGDNDFFNQRDEHTQFIADIVDKLDDDIAVFMDGQIYVDLIKFLEKVTENQELVECFKNFFDVDKFLELASQESLGQGQDIPHEQDFVPAAKKDIYKEERNVFDDAFKKAYQDIVQGKKVGQDQEKPPKQDIKPSVGGPSSNS